MISHHHKCVFVHIPKNAGQSIEQVFLDLLGLTWETRAPLLLRHNDRSELEPPKLVHLKWWEYSARKYMTQGQFDEYFRFAIVRNPWARVVSMYECFGFHRKCSFGDFVLKHFQSRLWSDFQWFVGPQCGFICDDNDCLRVNFVGRVENLQSDFRQVCERIGLPPIEVPHIHASRHEPESTTSSTFGSLWFRHPRPKQPRFTRFQDYYDHDSREVISKLYERDIALFKYDFDGALAGRSPVVGSNQEIPLAS